MSSESTIKVETLVQAPSLYQVLTSMPGIRGLAAPVFQDETLGKTFNTGAQLAGVRGVSRTGGVFLPVSR